MEDIKTEDDVKLMVHSFYAQVRQDETLSPIFNEAIKGDWEPHLKIMCEFWNTMLLYTRQYLNDPMKKHINLMVEPKHFERWLQLFEATVDKYFVGNNANSAKIRAANIARIMQAVILKNQL